MSKRLGKRERQLRKEQWSKFREVRALVVRDNVAAMGQESKRVAGVPYNMLAGRPCQLSVDNLHGHSHTQNAYVGASTGAGKRKPKPIPSRWVQGYMDEEHKPLAVSDPPLVAEVWKDGKRVRKLDR